MNTEGKEQDTQTNPKTTDILIGSFKLRKEKDYSPTEARDGGGRGAG